MKTVETELTYIKYIEKHPKFTGCIIDCDGDKAWCLNGKYHRTDGPALEWADGSKFWYLNGELHRTKGPAIEGADGSKSWFLNGKLHRTDGPAIEMANGSKFWYLNGERLTKKEWEFRVSPTYNGTDREESGEGIRKLITYITDDDCEHATLEEAQQHKETLNFSKWYKDNKLPRVTDEKLQEWLIKNKDKVMSLLSHAVDK